LIKILTISGSPVDDSSTDLILQQLQRAIIDNLPENLSADYDFIKLNDLSIKSCQACGDAPTPLYCFYDDISDVYKKLEVCDLLLFGSPVYFDSVSAQAKLFIDRCNCFRPADFDNRNPEHDFIKLLKRKRPGAMVLVGGEDCWFEGARRVIAGLFKWVEVVNEGLVKYISVDYNKKGTVLEDDKKITETIELGKKLASLFDKSEQNDK
jgi:multimeric flavodoxin WrbA